MGVAIDTLAGIDQVPAVQAAMHASIRAARRYADDPSLAGIASIDALRLLVGRGVENIFSSSDLFRLDRRFDAAGRTEYVAIDPGEKYRDLVAAVARDLDGVIIRTVHDWPILSTGDPTPVVAEAGGVTSAPGGGLPA